jgi:putative methyltransferase (TIGR04325 family)
MKKIAKRFAPEFLLQLARVVREARYRSRLTYSGVYSSFDEVPSHGGGYEANEWPATAAQYARWAIAKNESGFIPSAVTNENALLPLLVATTGASRILDFGGAAGFSYIATKYGAMCEIERYVVVEHPKVCDQGREIFKGDPRVEFIESIPNEQFDLIVIGSALQYVSDFREMLKTLTNLRPRWFLFTKLPAGENVTFVTAQVNLPGMAIANWLFNAKELVLIMESLDYRLNFRGATDAPVNQENFELKYKIEKFCNLLFEASEIASK